MAGPAVASRRRSGDTMAADSPTTSADLASDHPPATDGSPGLDRSATPAAPPRLSPPSASPFVTTPANPDTGARTAALEASSVCAACGYDTTGAASAASCPGCHAKRAAATPPQAAAQPPVASTSTWAPLRHKHYRSVWLGQFGSSVGGWMESVGVGWIVATTSEKPSVMLGLVAVAQLGPMMVLGIHGGIVADRADRKQLLLVTQGLMMVIAIALAVVSALSGARPSSWVLILLILLNGIAMAYNAPAWQVLTPRLVPREELTRAIYLNGLQFNLARAVGPALAGVLYYLVGPTYLFVINAVSFVGVLWAVSTTPGTPKPPPATVSIWAQLCEALRFVLHQKGPRSVFIGVVIFGMLAAPLMRLMPMFVTHVFTLTRDPNLASGAIDLNAAAHGAVHGAGNSWYYGLLLAAMGLGAVSGVFLKKLVPPWYPAHHFIPLSFLGGGLTIALFGATTNYYVALAAIFACGLFWLWAFNSGFAAIQMLVPDAMRGRVMALVNVAVFGSMAIGPLITGKLAEGLDTKHIHIEPGQGVQIGVATTGVLLSIASLIMLIWRTPEVDGLKPGDVGYDRKPGLLRGILATAHRPRA